MRRKLALLCVVCLLALHCASLAYAASLADIRRAAEQGDTDQQNELGRMYREGDGVARDYATARYWLEGSGVSGLMG